MDSLTSATVNNTGVIEAKTIQNKAGRILLMGDMAYGTVNVGGTLDASAPGWRRRRIHRNQRGPRQGGRQRQGHHIGLGRQHRKWLIDPNDFTIPPRAT
jgi:hypothetical protein